LIGTKFTKLKDGFQVYDQKITFDVGERINTERIAVRIYTKASGTTRPALAGVIANNRTTFIADLDADQEVTTPTGVTKNIGFASAVVWSPPGNLQNFFLSVVLNHDLDQTVTAVHVHAPAASNQNGVILVNFPDLLNRHAGKILNFPINATVMEWFLNNLAYINVHTTQNTGGALRGQLIPTTSARYRTPLFPNGATQGGVTILGDGSLITGDVGTALKNGGART